MGKQGRVQKKLPLHADYRLGRNVEIEYQGEWLPGIVSQVDGPVVHVVSLCGPVAIRDAKKIRLR